MTLPEFQKHSTNLARGFAVMLAVSLPFSTALDNILLGLMLLFWIMAGNYREHWVKVRSNSVALVAIGFVGLIAIGLFYGEHSIKDGLRYSGKYADSLLVPILITLFDDTLWRRRARLALAIGLLLLLALSYLVAFGIIPPNPWMRGTMTDPVVFKLSLTHGILMAFGAFFFALRAADAQQYSWRIWWLGCTALAVGNVLFMVPGRTGYVVLVLLMLYLGYVWKRLPGLMLCGLGCAIAFALGIMASTTLQQRIATTVQEFHQWQPASVSQTSIGLRLEFYRNTLAIIHEHPLVGVGTGGFPQAYKKRVAGTGMTPTDNPHNEYLNILVQLGIAGLVMLLALFWVPWRTASRLPTSLEQHLARGLVLTIAAGCIFNSLLIDHTERLLFAWGLGILFAGLQSPSTPLPTDRT